MNQVIKIFMGLVISLGLFSCVEEPRKVEGPYTDVLNFVQESKRLNIGLEKRVFTAVGVETKTIANPDWAIELQPFIDADFNKPGAKSKYTQTVTESSLSGWKDVVYNSTDEKSNVNWALYRFIDSTCVAASINVKRTSSAYNFSEQLTYMAGSGYTINNQQDLAGLDENSMNLNGAFAGQPQPWRIFFDIGEQNVPVNLMVTKKDEGISMQFSQGKERFEVKAIHTDSGFYAEMPVFQAYLIFELKDDKMKGQFVNLDKGTDYRIPFTANRLMYDQMFGYNPNENQSDFTGKWETYFYDSEKDSSAAIGLFDRLGNDLIGTFATTTGDYRFLQGKVVGDSFSLSTFDGSHLFLFTGRLAGNEIIDGHFYSGSHYHSTWKAVRNSDFELTDPNSMTQMQESNKMDFSFPDLSGNMVSLSDEKYQNKVIIVQILGSWCPNCMDETRYFKELYSQYNAHGLEIVGLGFERSKDFEVASKVLKKAIKDLDVPYPVLIAGTPKESQKALPMITPIKSYPTSIFVNRKGEVVKIHTGFYGPSTGKYYEDYKIETEEFIENLLSE